MTDAIDQIERSSAQRIVHATLRVEQMLRNSGPGRGNWHNGDRDRWIRLTSDLDAGGTATGVMMEWDATGDGDYDADTDHTDAVTVIDPTAQHWGVEGELLLCRPMGTDNGDVFEVIRPGKEWHRGVIYDLVCRDQSVDVTITIHGVDRTVVAWNVFSPTGECLVPTGSAGMRVGITYNCYHLPEYDIGEWAFGANASGLDYTGDGSGSGVVTDPRWELTEAECG